MSLKHVRNIIMINMNFIVCTKILILNSYLKKNCHCQLTKYFINDSSNDS